LNQLNEGGPTQRAATWGTRRVILAFLAAFGFFRFGGESTLPPQAANASRWARLENGHRRLP